MKSALHIFVLTDSVMASYIDGEYEILNQVYEDMSDMIVYDEPNKCVERESADDAGSQNENLSDNLEIEDNPSYITGSLLNVRKLVRVDDSESLTSDPNLCYEIVPETQSRKQPILTDTAISGQDHQIYQQENDNVKMKQNSLVTICLQKRQINSKRLIQKKVFVVITFSILYIIMSSVTIFSFIGLWVQNSET